MDALQPDTARLRYALYVRKSTDDAQKQIRSIDDQIDECRELALRMHLRVIGRPIIEKRSAKKPGNRPKFRDLLRDIRAGTYDGILAWNPDRLARNMKEGGEIIDMIDEGILLDLKFVTHHFSNDANGKMLLGMAFVLSKQYSDNLSQNVRRGVRKSLEEGKALNSKHGYIRDEQGFQVPDGQNYTLICEAWRQRPTGASLEAISSMMNKQGYGKLIKSTGKLVRMDKRILSDIFKDPFYYGILVQAEQKVDLRQIYDFQAATTEENYFAVQALSNRRIQPYKQRRKVYYPFKMMVFCSFCGNYMYAGAPKGHTKRYLFYRCDKDTCPRKKKSIRGKVILDFIYAFLEDGLCLTEQAYHDYYDGMVHLTRQKLEQLLIELHSQQARLKLVSSELRERSLKVLEVDKASAVRRVNEQRIQELEEQEKALEDSIAKLKNRLPNPASEKLSLEQFLNLSKYAGNVVKSASAVVKDKICRFVFLNFTVDEEKVVSYLLKPPFDTLLKTRQARFVGFGAPRATNLELLATLAEAIARHWNPEDFDETLLEITEASAPQDEYVY